MIVYSREIRGFMKQYTGIFLIAFIAVFSSCTPKVNLPEKCSPKSIVAHPQYSLSDQIVGFGWQPDSVITLEIDDPTTSEVVDYSDSQVAELTDVECATINFFPGDAWDLHAGHLVILSDGKTTIQHIVQDLHIEEIDIEADTFSGRAKPGSEVMVWVEFPYEHEIRTTANAEGHWFVDFTDTTDIIDSSTGAVAQNDDPSSDSHTRINWNFDHFHIEASLVDDQITFFDVVPFGELTFKIHKSIDGELLHEDKQASNKLGEVWFLNKDREIDLVPGAYIIGLDETTGKEGNLEMAYLTLEAVNFENDTLSGLADPSKTVVVYAYDLLSEDEHVLEVICNSEGEWLAEFDVDLHKDMELYARVFDGEDDETSIRWIPIEVE